MEQARLAMVNAFDLGYKKEVAPILPYGIYTIPEASMAGESETSLKASVSTTSSAPLRTETTHAAKLSATSTVS